MRLTRLGMGLVALLEASLVPRLAPRPSFEPTFYQSTSPQRSGGSAQGSTLHPPFSLLINIAVPLPEITEKPREERPRLSVVSTGRYMNEIRSVP